MTTRFYILLAVLAVISATIPRTLIDSGNIFIHTGTQQTVNPSAGQVFSFTIGFTKSFSTVPSFAVLLHGATILSDQNTAGFQVLTDTPTLTGVDFNVTNFVGESSTVRMNFVWVAATGQYLQFFPISLTLSADQITQNAVFDVSFNYPSLVQWSSGTFEVGITSVISSFTITSALAEGIVDMTIAKWNGAAYDYSGDSHFILPNNQLYGPNRPFTLNGDTNVVKMYAGGYSGTTINSYLIFQKIQQLPGPIITGFGILRDHLRDTQVGFLTASITDNTYNQPIPSPVPSSIVYIYGLESFRFTVTPQFQMTALIASPDGATLLEMRGIDWNSQSSSLAMRSFVGTYYIPCPAGCVCTDGSTCSSCLPSTYRVADPVEDLVCPCIPYFYEAADKTCQQCPKDSFCETCQLKSGGSIECLTCKCSNHRQLNGNGACVCKTGYQQATPTAGPYCVRS